MTFFLRWFFKASKRIYSWEKGSGEFLSREILDVPDHRMRPPIPTDWLQRPLAWPSGSPHDEATIAWMVHDEATDQ